MLFNFLLRYELKYYHFSVSSFNPDPKVRHSFWTLTFGATFTWLALYAVNQALVQRSLSVPTLRQAQL